MSIEATPTDACDFYFVRHLEPQLPGGKKVLCGGASVGSDRDTGLTPESQAKTAALAMQLREKLGTIGAVYSSPYQRTLQTIQPLGPAQTDARLNELNHGEAQLAAGVDWKKTEHWQKYSQLTRVEKLTTPQSPGAESNCDVIDRVRQFVFEKASLHMGQKVVCASHDGAMRSLLNLKAIEALTGPLGTRASAEAVKTISAQTKIDDAKHFDKGEIFHIRAFPKEGRIEVIH